MEKLHFRCFLYKWVSVIKEVELGAVSPISCWCYDWITGFLQDKNDKTWISFILNTD